MNSRNTTGSLSYYRLSLLSFLKESHPEKADDTVFINARVDLACEAYSQAIKNGYGHPLAQEWASEVLFHDLHFSKHDTLVNILWNEFADEIPQGSAKVLAINLLPECEVVFAHYPLTDDFAYSPEYDLLYTELTGTILIWLEEHGL